MVNIAKTLEQIAERESPNIPDGKDRLEEIYLHENSKEYLLFSEQYLEKPYNPSSPQAFLTLTVCTIKGIPLIDDPDWDDR